VILGFILRILPAAANAQLEKEGRKNGLHIIFYNSEVKKFLSLPRTFHTEK
jgi:hypothetical protein